MEKCWVTTDAYFLLLIMLIGINVCDAWKIADYCGIINWTKNESDGKMTILLMELQVTSLPKMLLLMINPLNVCFF
jgi:hypothetical protein